MVVGADGWMSSSGSGHWERKAKKKQRNDVRRTSQMPSILRANSHYHDDVRCLAIDLISSSAIGRHPVDTFSCIRAAAQLVAT